MSFIRTMNGRKGNYWGVSSIYRSVCCSNRGSYQYVDFLSFPSSKLPVDVISVWTFFYGVSHLAWSFQVINPSALTPLPQYTHTTNHHTSTSNPHLAWQNSFLLPCKEIMLVFVSVNHIFLHQGWELFVAEGYSQLPASIKDSLTWPYICGCPYITHMDISFGGPSELSHTTRDSASLQREACPEDFPRSHSSCWV